ncbi:MAG: hypothetical protein GC158_09420 [Cyanobacteria bacterium RI_101]|nr:hypothetical protein [Cyanobacteria bacterium RI_101]
MFDCLFWWYKSGYLRWAPFRLAHPKWCTSFLNRRVNKQEYLKYQKQLNENTVLISINGTIGNIAFYNSEKVVLGKSVCYFNLSSEIEKQYIKKVLESNYFTEYALSSATGTTIQNVSLKAMRLFLIPLPPLPEQRRIVAKVDALTALCDRLENQIDQQTAKQTQLLDAVMAGI